MQRHDIWRRVQHDYQEALRRATDGYEPVVQVYIAGRAEPMVLGFVRTRQAPDEVWVRFEAEAPAASEDEIIPPECYWVHAPESAILAIEVSYRIKDSARIRVGFRYEQSD